MLVMRMPFAIPIRTTGCHVISNPDQFLPVHRIGIRVIGVDTSDTAHDISYHGYRRSGETSHPICELTILQTPTSLPNARIYYFRFFLRSKCFVRIKGDTTSLRPFGLT